MPVRAMWRRRHTPRVSADARSAVVDIVFALAAITSRYSRHWSRLTDRSEGHRERGTVRSIVVTGGLVSLLVACGGGTPPSLTVPSASPTPAPALTQSPSPAPTGEYGVAKWVVTPVQLDPITDERQAGALLQSEPSSQGSTSAATLAILCARNEVNLMIGWEDYIGTEASTVSMETRVGSEPATSDTWFLWSSQTTGPLGDQDGMKGFIEKLLNNTRFSARVQGASGAPTVVFDISGIEQAITPVRQACDW